MSNSLQPHGLEHARLPCHSPSPEVCSNSCPLNWWCHPTISCSVAPSPAFNLSQHQSIFQWAGSSHQVTKVLELHISPSNVYSVLISFGIDWFYLLASQGTLKSLLHHHSWKASILQRSAFFFFFFFERSAFFIVNLSHPYMTTRKITALTIQTFVDKVISLLFTMLSRFVIAFLLRNMIHNIRSCDLMLLASSDEKTEVLGEWIQVFPTF